MKVGGATPLEKKQKGSGVEQKAVPLSQTQVEPETVPEIQKEVKVVEVEGRMLFKMKTCSSLLLISASLPPATSAAAAAAV
jgi:hypothetical protein